MAQAGFTPIRLYSSITTAAVPTAGNMVQGELAINTTDGKLFYEDSSGVVQVIATKDAAAGNFTTLDLTNIEVTNIKAKDGTAAGSIANTTGVFTLASSVLTTTDINGGTIDATVIGATTPSTVVATQVDITAQGDLRLQDTSGGQYVALQAPSTVATSYTLTLPVDDGTPGQALVTDGSGVLSWAPTTIAADVTVTTTSASSNFVVPFANTTVATTGNYGLLQDSTAAFTYNPSTNTLTAGTFVGALTGNATTATSSTTAAKGTNTTQIATTAFVNTEIANLNSEVANVLDFGAIGDGVADDTAEIQAAINSLISTGGIVYFPPGTYKVSSTLSWTANGITLVGAGRSATIIRTYIANGDVIAIGSSSVATSNGGVRELNITASTTQITGAGIRLTQCYSTIISDVIIGYGLYTGIGVDGYPLNYENLIQNFVISNCTFGIAIGNSGSVVQDITVTNGEIGSCTGTGILLTHVSGCYLDNVGIISSDKGVTTFPAVGQSVANCFFTTVLCDTCTTNGFAFFSGGGNIEQFNMVNCWGSTCGQNGLLLSPQCNAFAITNFRAINNQQNGMLIQGGTNIGLSNCQALSNSMQGSNLYNGLAIDGTVTDNITIIGGKYGFGWLGAGFNNQNYGIFISAGNINNYAIIGADVTGNVTGGILDGGTGVVKYIYGTPGYVTSNSGTGTILSGATSVTISHGLSVTPTAANINITANSFMGSNPFIVDSATISSTTFQVKTSSAVAANSNFSWQVRASGA